MTQPDITDPSDKIFTINQVAKNIGIPALTLRRLIREGTLWATSMENGGLGLRKSEIQRFLDQFVASPQMNLADANSDEVQMELADSKSIEALLRTLPPAYSQGLE